METQRVLGALRTPLITHSGWTPPRCPEAARQRSQEGVPEYDPGGPFPMAPGSRWQLLLRQGKSAFWSVAGLPFPTPPSRVSPCRVTPLLPPWVGTRGAGRSSGIWPLWTSVRPPLCTREGAPCLPVDVDGRRGTRKPGGGRLQGPHRPPFPFPRPLGPGSAETLRWDRLRGWQGWRLL